MSVIRKPGLYKIKTHDGWTQATYDDRGRWLGVKGPVIAVGKHIKKTATNSFLDIIL